MNRQNESVLPALIFLWTIWALSQYAALAAYAIGGALALWGMGWLAYRMFGSATHRLGLKGWRAILELILWYGLFLWLVPLEAVTKILLLWGVATPLLFVGAIWRQVYLRLPGFQWLFDEVPRGLCGVALIAVPGWSWFEGLGLLFGFLAAVAICTLTAIPLYYGWRLAEPLPRGERDARFGTQDSYRTAGMSDDR